MGAKILVIDDEPVIVDLVKFALELEGFTVITAEDGEQGITMAKTEKPDLVVLDIRLPGMNGYEICQQLKSDGITREIPVVLLSVKAAPEDIHAGLEAGADDYVPKPFEPAKLIKIIRKNLAA